jgi:hypothetical protein
VRILGRARSMTPLTVLAAVLVTMLMSGGAYATASTLISGKQVKDHSLTGRDIKNRSLNAKLFRKGTLLRGAKGAPGVNGASGAQGAIGPMGAMGAMGATGATGATGLAGQDGAACDPSVYADCRGDKGEKGDKGDQGAAGHDGLNGNDGAPGQSGEQGAQGPKGDKGDQGNPGHDGLNGKDGAPGQTGEQGAQGPKGDKGPQGDRGPAGLADSIVITGTGADGSLVTVTCPAGKIAIGGGVNSDNASNRVGRSNPSSAHDNDRNVDVPIGWSGRIDKAPGQNGVTTVHVICTPGLGH